MPEFFKAASFSGLARLGAWVSVLFLSDHLRGQIEIGSLEGSRTGPYRGLASKLDHLNKVAGDPNRRFSGLTLCQGAWSGITILSQGSTIFAIPYEKRFKTMSSIWYFWLSTILHGVAIGPVKCCEVVWVRDQSHRPHTTSTDKAMLKAKCLQNARI